MTGRGLTPLLRLAALVAGALAVSEAVRRLVSPPLGHLLAALVTAGRPRGQVSLETVVAGGCAIALTLAWAWLLLCAAAVAVHALRPCPAVKSLAATLPGCPRWVRATVLATLGLAVSAGPALADTPGAPAPAADLVGLAVPDRVASPLALVRHHRVRVRPGDTLWSIASHQLVPTAGDRAVDRAWRRLAAANPDRVGDPDLIFPGTVLRVPDLDRPTRKEAP